MTLVSPSQITFSNGEISPLMHGRSDLDTYISSLAVCENFVVLPHGVLVRRPGTRYVAACKYPDRAVKLIALQYSRDDSYMLEFGDGYMRVYRDLLPVVRSNNSIYELSTGINASQLEDISVTQVKGDLYIAHKDFTPKKLSRVSHDNWTITSHSMTAKPSEWTSGSYPRLVTSFQSRLVYASTPNHPNTFWLSKTGDVDNFTIGLEPVDGIKITTTDNLNDIQFMEDGQHLMIGTAAATRTIGGVGPEEPLTPQSMYQRKHTPDGAAKIKPVTAGDAVLYVSFDGKKLREFEYTFEKLKYRSPDITTRSEHILGEGARDMAYTADPFGIVWIVRKDGQLAGLTYDSLQQVYAWHRHKLGGVSDDEDAQERDWAEVLSIDAVPMKGRDVLWLAVRRKINGEVKTYIEYMDAFFRAPDISGLDANGQKASLKEARKKAYFMDCGGLLNFETAVNEVNNFAHLEGEELVVLRDGERGQRVTVTAGSFNLVNNDMGHVIAAGLPYRSFLKTLRTEGNLPAANARSKKEVLSVVDMFEAAELKIGKDIENLYEVNFRDLTRHYIEEVPLLKTGNIKEYIGDSYQEDGELIVVADGPLPCGIRGFVRVQDVGGAA